MGKMSKPDKAWIEKSPIDFLYAFVTEDFLGLVAEYISTTAARTIRQKRQYQIKYLTIIYGGADKVNYDEVRELIKGHYGLTPMQILCKLLQGDTVAGKNWREGVYGVGATKYMDGYASDANLKVDTATGALIDKSTGQRYQGVATYDKKGNITDYTYSLNGGTYTTKYDKSTGKFYANTYGTADNMYYADNSKYSPETASSVWENISTAMPMIENFLNWLSSVMGSFGITGKVATVKETVMSQKELSTSVPQGSESGLSTAIIAGAALLGGMLILSGKK